MDVARHSRRNNVVSVLEHHKVKSVAADALPKPQFNTGYSITMTMIFLTISLP